MKIFLFIEILFQVGNVIPQYGSVNLPTAHVPAAIEGNQVETKIEDGKLLYERRWFHRGQPVYVEGIDMSRFGANISAIGTEAVSYLNTNINNRVIHF